MGKRNRPRKSKANAPKYTVKNGVLVLVEEQPSFGIASPAEPERKELWVPGRVEGEHITEDGVMNVAAASEEGQNALVRILEEYKSELPEEALSANYDGIARESADTTVTIELRTMPVAWGFPFDEIVFSRWIINLMGIRMMPWDDYITSLSTYLPDARNIVHRRFVEDSKAPWLMMLDSDVLCPPDIINRLMAHDKKMVGGWYRMKADPYAPVVYDMHDNLFDEKGTPLYRMRDEPGEGLESVDGAGAGVWLMSREVAEALGPTPYHMDDGGEDLLLCRKVHDLGYETFIDWDTPCAHCGVAYV